MNRRACSSTLSIRAFGWFGRTSITRGEPGGRSSSPARSSAFSASGLAIDATSRPPVVLWNSKVCVTTAGPSAVAGGIAQRAQRRHALDRLVGERVAAGLVFADAQQELDGAQAIMARPEGLAERLAGLDYQLYQAGAFEYAEEQLAGYNMTRPLLYLLVAILLAEQVLAWSASYHPSRRGGLGLTAKGGPR